MKTIEPRSSQTLPWSPPSEAEAAWLMRIALFTGNYNYVREGANQALNRLVDYLERRRGAQVRVYSPVTDTPAFEPAGTLVPVRSIPLPVRSEFRLAPGLPRDIRRDVAVFQPDLVHIATPDILGARALTFARRRGLPAVASFHTRFETYLEHYRLAWLRPLAEAHLHRFYRRSTHVLAPTRAIADEMRRLRGDSAVSLWGRGVDRELFDPARRSLEWRRARGIADEELVVLYFGRLVLEKGVRRFVTTIQALKARGLPARALVVGAGPAAPEFAPLRDAVLTGHLDGPALATAVASADLLLNPSRTEAFGNVVLEAMASGLAVVSADAPSASALVEPGVSGLLCPPGHPGSYVEAIASLAADPVRRHRLGRTARAASENFSWDAASASAVQAYDRLLQRRAPTARPQWVARSA